MSVLSSFEILAENLVPGGILPPGAKNPFLIQGYFVQISLVPGVTVSQVQYNLIFEETTDFNQGSGQKALQAQYIDSTGQVNIYKQFFASTGRGFLNQKISKGNTVIYGVQAIPGLTTKGIPQAGTGWRGTVQVTSNYPGSLVATPTQRLVYYDGTNPLKDAVLDAVVYALPTFSGGTQI